MNLVESIRIALRALAANKLRSALTMLGIIIGVGAVITLLSVGQGVQVLVTTRLQSMGSNLLFILPGDLEGQLIRRGQLTDQDALAVADPTNVPDVVAVVPELWATARVIYGKKEVNLMVAGVTPAYSKVRNAPVAEGSFITEEEQAAGSRVVVLGHRARKRLFSDDVYPIGQTVKINGIPFKVIGIMEEKGGSAFGSADDEIFVPLNTAQRRLFPYRRSPSGEYLLSVIYAQVASEDRMEAAMDQIANLLRNRHNITYRDEDDFTIINQADLINIFGEITGVLTIFLGSIAAISLLVGGIGIMNIMLVSVTERTREIGIRKAIGAKRRDILIQFLIEAVVLSMIGGAIGILLGFAGSQVVSSLAQELKTVVSLQAVLLATGFSAAVGLFFGIYPATRAARLNPIDALRYE